MLRRRYRLSPRSRIAAAGDSRWLICDHPLQALPLSADAAALVSALDGNLWLDELVQSPTPEWIDTLDGLVERGLLLAEYRGEPPSRWPPVHVVIPAYQDLERLARCLQSLAALDYPRDALSVTVVDDSSPRPLASAAGAAPLAVQWVRLERNSGPASARNAGVAALGALGAGALLAFIDSDCEAEAGWLRELVGIMEGAEYAAVGGGVRGRQTDSLLGRYEDACSSLHMGEQPGRAAGKDARVPYLPTCNLMVRAGAFRALGGFRERWRTGEDVDFCWRLAGSGERLFYWPNAAVRHDHRTTWRVYLARKREYARSEGPLARVHPGRFAVRIESCAFDVAIILWGLALALTPLDDPPRWGLAGVGIALVAGVGAARFARAVRRWPRALWPLPMRVLLGALGRQLAARTLRESRWVLRHLALPLLLACVAMPALWPIGVGIAVLGSTGEWLARRPPLAKWEFAAGWLGECLAYSLGWLEGLAMAGWKRPGKGHRKRWAG